MNLFSYVITRDYGFAPNPYFEICSLATCKPVIRGQAQVGDCVCGFAGKNTIVGGKLVYLMKVTEKLTFEQYWKDERYICKRPNFTRSKKFCYGDNIYHKNTQSGQWLQENSHHSYDDGINYKNLSKDTGKDAVLLSNTYWYFGNRAINIPCEFNEIIASARAHKRIKNEGLILHFLKWIEREYEQGINGIPFSWNAVKGFERYKGES